tara:strand:+ start:253 stop:1074 length:822 start_codon:yes stop_codon:yes gene_type:complete
MTQKSEKKIIIITGNETRHVYFRKFISNHPQIKVLLSLCEGTELSLEKRVKNNQESSLLEYQHVEARTQSEEDFFRSSIENMVDKSNPKFIQKGSINDEEVVEEILAINPDLLVCYGSSLVKSKLLEVFDGNFLNVHLGLSPYYRGSGTNIWPMINNELDMVGVTFMFIDSGIDTGKIIHQIRADIFLGDSPHSIGNRLIKKMSDRYAQLIINFERLEAMNQPVEEGKLYLKKDFDSIACRKLYDNFLNGIIEEYLKTDKMPRSIIENPVIPK